MNPANNDSLVSPYLVSSMFTSRFHQHLNHLNDLAFNHTKLLKEMMEKRSFAPNDLAEQRKRSFPEMESAKIDSQSNKRPRKQSNPQQLPRSDEDASKDETATEPTAPPISMEKIFETFQKEFLNASPFGMKRFFPSPLPPLPLVPPALPGLFPPLPNFSSFPRLALPTQHTYPPFHFAAAKKRRTKVGPFLAKSILDPSCSHLGDGYTIVTACTNEVSSSRAHECQ